MSNELPYRFLLIQQGTYLGVLKISYINDANKLLILLELYDLKQQLIQSLKDSFHANPLCESVFESLGKSLRKRNIFGMGFAEDLVSQIDQLDFSQPQILIKFPDFNLWLDKKNIYRLRYFLIQYLSSYDILSKLYINIEYHNKQELNTVTVEQNQQKIPESQVQNNKVLEHNNLIIENDISQLLSDILSLTKSNILKYYIIKLIIDYNQYNNIITQSNNELIIETTPLLQTNNLSSKTIANDIEYILNSLAYQREESSEIVKQCIKQICYIIQLNKTESEYYTLIRILQFIIFIYVLNSKQPAVLNKYLNEGIYNIGEFINWVTNLSIDYLIVESLIDVPYKKIQFKGPTKVDLIIDDNTKIRDIEKIDVAIEKYKYQLDIDKESYLKHVSLFIDKSDNIKDQAIRGFLIGDEKHCNLTQSTVLSIPYLLTNKHINPLLHYQLLDSKEEHKYITKEYCDVIRLANNQQLNDDNIKILKEINNTIALNATRINNIMITLAKIKTKTSPMNTISLIHNYIFPEFYNNGIKTSFETLLFILYRIIIPYLYDMYNINEFIDYFTGNSIAIEGTQNPKIFK